MLALARVSENITSAHRKLRAVPDEVTASQELGSSSGDECHPGNRYTTRHAMGIALKGRNNYAWCIHHSTFPHHGQNAQVSGPYMLLHK